MDDNNNQDSQNDQSNSINQSDYVYQTPQSNVENQNPYVQHYHPQPSHPAKTLGIIGIVLGSLSIVLAVLCLPGIFIILSIPAIVLGAMGMNKAKKSNFNTPLPLIALILGIVGTVINLIVIIIIAVFFLVGAAGALNSF